MLLPVGDSRRMLPLRHYTIIVCFHYATIVIAITVYWFVTPISAANINEILSLLLPLMPRQKTRYQHNNYVYQFDITMVTRDWLRQCRHTTRRWLLQLSAVSEACATPHSRRWCLSPNTIMFISATLVRPLSRQVISEYRLLRVTVRHSRSLVVVVTLYVDGTDGQAADIVGQDTAAEGGMEDCYTYYDVWMSIPRHGIVGVRFEYRDTLRSLLVCSRYCIIRHDASRDSITMKTRRNKRQPREPGDG